MIVNKVLKNTFRFENVSGDAAFGVEVRSEDGSELIEPLGDFTAGEVKVIDIPVTLAHATDEWTLQWATFPGNPPQSRRFRN